MTPAARVQAAIEVLDLVIAAARSGGAPADRILADWFRARRFAGGSDRRAVRDLVYRAVRACGEAPLSGRAAMLLVARDDALLAGLFDGSRHAPPPIAPDEPVAEAGTAPRWLERALADSGIAGGELTALLDRAPLDVRRNTLKPGPWQVPVDHEPTVARHGLRFPAGTPIESWDAWRDGHLEVQDTGSQLACDAVGTQPGETVIDLCAGAGGKTLALAADGGPSARIVACDIHRDRLAKLMPRAERAGAGAMIETVLLDPGREAAALAGWEARADAVLVDAPCSGTGTWRRNPEARWRLTEAALARYASEQARLLDIAASLARPGGRLVYVTCSLLDGEGSDQIDAFLARNAGWRAEPPHLPAGRPRGAGIRLTPAHDATDGFFIARLLRL